MPPTSSLSRSTVPGATNAQPESPEDGSFSDINAWVDRVCDHYEADRLAGRQPTIEQALLEQQAQQPARMQVGRSALLRQLWGLEREYREREGRPPTLDELQQRFPEDWRAVECQNPDCGANPNPLASPRIPGYEILEEVARGAMGIVYRTIAKDTNRHVALKTPLAQYSSGPDLARLKNEYYFLTQIQHRNVVSVQKLFDHHGQWFVEMEFVDGVDFLRYVRAGLTVEGAFLDPTINLGAGSPAPRFHPQQGKG